MGQRSPTETLFGIIAAFVERPTWSQAELARKLETRPETIRKHLTELMAGGFKLERSEDHPHVYWSVPKNWFPGAVPFKADEVPDLLRLVRRAPKGELRDRVVGVVMARLANLGQGRAVPAATAVRAPEMTEDEQRWFGVIEDAASGEQAITMRYFTASRSRESWRSASVHGVSLVPRPSFIATCHRTGALKRFRIRSVLEAKVDRREPFRPVVADALAKFERESVDGFTADGAAVLCAFVVRDPESAWVERSLPDAAIVTHPAPGGLRFEVTTAAVTVLARFVVGLGDAAHAMTPALSKEVRRIAKGALRPASGPSSRDRG